MFGKHNGFEKTEMTHLLGVCGVAYGMCSNIYTIGTLFIGESPVCASGKDSSVINCTSPKC